MDPVSVIGLSTTAFSIVERLAKTLNFLLQLSTKLKFADVKITLLIGFLGSINAAVHEIGNIAKKLSGHIQYQKLAENLVITLDCTKVSLSFLESQLAELQSSSQDERSLVDKFTIILKDAEFESYVNGISTNVTALNLVLNALQSHSLLEQQGILDNPDAKSILVAVQDETSSLHCIADNRSILSKQSKASETSTALDVLFDFDAEILRSRSYGVAYRSHLRQAIASRSRQDKTVVPGEEAPQSAPKNFDPIKTVLAGSLPLSDRRHVESQNVNAALQDSPFPITTDLDVRTDIADTRSKKAMKEKIVPRHKGSTGRVRSDKRSSTLSVPEASPLRDRHEMDSGRLKILLLGSSESGKSTLLNGSKLWLEGRWTKSERESFSEVIYSNVCQGFRAVLVAMETLKIPLEVQWNGHHVQTIFMQPVILESMPADLHQAFMALSGDKGFQATLERRREYQLMDNIDYLINSIDRIAAKDYVPSDKDILLSRVKTTGITETIFDYRNRLLGQLMNFSIFDCGGTRSERRKWIHAYRDTDMVLFTVDIGCYDQLLEDDDTTNRMEDSLTLFDVVLKSEWLKDVKIVLCFTKQAKLAAKLDKSPLEIYFPDFAYFQPYHPHRLPRATDYFIHRFKSINKDFSKVVKTIVMPDVPEKKDIEAIEDLLWRARMGKPTKLPS